MGEDLLLLSELVDIVHFVEAGPIAIGAEVDIAFVEGSISTPEEQQRIQEIRQQSKLIVTLGACATSGGIQALRNGAKVSEWVNAIYASPEHIQTLDSSTPISAHIKVDFELHGCPINAKQLIAVVRQLLDGIKPQIQHEKVCLECKRQGHVCVVVAHGMPCMGPVTQTGCDALCPSARRGCYACFGKAENTNMASLETKFTTIKLPVESIKRHKRFITNID